MNEPVQIFVPGVPQPQGSKRAFVHRGTGKAVMVETCKGTKSWRNMIASAAAQVFKTPSRAAVHLHATFLFTRPKGHFTSRGVLRDRFSYCPKTSKPDIDKLARSLLDSLTAIVYVDDSQVVELRATKTWCGVSAAPGVLIRVQFDEEIA